MGDCDCAHFVLISRASKLSLLYCVTLMQTQYHSVGTGVDCSIGVVIFILYLLLPRKYMQLVVDWQAEYDARRGVPRMVPANDSIEMIVTFHPMTVHLVSTGASFSIEIGRQEDDDA